MREKRIIPEKKYVRGMDWKFFSTESILKEKREKLEPKRNLYTTRAQYVRQWQARQWSLLIDELKSQVTGRSTQLTSLFSFSVSGRHSRQEDRTCYLNSSQSRQHNCKKTGMFLCLSLYSQYDLNCISLFLFTSAFTRLTQAFISMHLNCCLGFSTNFPAL